MSSSGVRGGAGSAGAVVRSALSVRRHPRDQDGAAVPRGDLPRQREQSSAGGERRAHHAVGAQSSHRQSIIQRQVLGFDSPTRVFSCLSVPQASD